MNRLFSCQNIKCGSRNIVAFFVVSFFVTMQMFTTSPNDEDVNTTALYATF